jgi:NAD(P)-dependent dehydrogenase (short-subunit alcohol dehydrogenase family)
MIFNVKDKISIITGAPGAIGQGIASLFHEAGAVVIVADRRLDPASVLAEKLGGKAEAVSFDQSDPDAIEAMVADIAKRHGRLDVLVNCAAAFGFQSFEQLTAAEWDRIHSVNLRGVAFCCKSAINAMKPKKTGSIVNISSISASRFVLYDSITYAVAKAGNEALTKSLAREFAESGIRINAVSPGAIENFAPDPAVRGITMRGPLMEPGFIPLSGQAGLPQDIAAACLYFASDAARYVTGQVLAVDGGISIA